MSTDSFSNKAIDINEDLPTSYIKRYGFGNSYYNQDMQGEVLEGWLEIVQYFSHLFFKRTLRCLMAINQDSGDKTIAGIRLLLSSPSPFMLQLKCLSSSLQVLLDMPTLTMVHDVATREELFLVMIIGTMPWLASSFYMFRPQAKILLFQ